MNPQFVIYTATPLPIVSKAHDAILNEIKQFYIRQENQTTDLSILYEECAFHQRKINERNSTDPNIYAKQIADMIDELEIEIPTSDWNHFFADLTAMIAGRSKPFQIENGMKKIAQYLNESKIWYHFLIEAHDIFSEYEMQKNVTKIAATEIITQIRSVKKDELKNINEIGLMQLLLETNKKIYAGVENMKVNQVKLNVLKNVLEQTIAAKINASCSRTELIVEGYNVKISDVVNRKCSEKIKIMKILALNKLYVDINVDKTGEELQLSMIAPTWEIIGGRQIILDGANGKAHLSLSAQDGVGPSGNGSNGFPGKAGGPAGYFFGIGKQFLPLFTHIMDGQLDIHLNGGIGGPGQHGGNGNAINLKF